MTRQEAEQYLRDLEAKRSKAHYLARFASSVPLAVSDPTAFDRKEEALVVLGRSKYCKPYEAVRRVYPGFPLCKWYKGRVRYGIVQQKANTEL